MIKSLYKSLLLKHPLLWNLKLPQVLVFILLSHGLFFLFGFFSVAHISQFKYIQRFDSSTVALNLIGGLILLLALIIWLMWYLRNNAFKQFYPVSINDLRKEFTIVFLIFLFGLPIFHTYAFGKHLHLKLIAREVNVYEDAKVVNLARHFLPINASDFSNENCCDTIKAQMKRNEITNAQKERCYGSEVNYTTSEEAANTTIDNTTQVYSLWHYCQTPVSLSNASTIDDINATAKRWLDHQQFDSIQLCLQQYFKLMDKYGVRHNVNVDSLMKSLRYMCLPVNQFTNSTSMYGLLTESYDYDNYTMMPMEPYHADFSGINSAIENVAENNKETFWTLSEWGIYGYLSLGFAILLMLFRLTRLKPWISSIIGAGLWSMIFGLMTVFAQSEFLYILLCYAIGTGILAWINIRRERNKLRSAMWLSWFSIAQFAIIPILFWIITENTKAKTACVNGYLEIVQKAAPIHDWLEMHDQAVLIYGNMGICFLVFMLIVIPLAYRWQANPSE